MADERPSVASIFDINLRTVAVMPFVVGILATMILVASATQAQTFAVLYNFAGNGSNGAPYYPYAGLAMTAGGSLYGTTSRGGTYENGTAFRLKRAGSGWLLNVLYSFQGGSEGATQLRASLLVLAASFMAPRERAVISHAALAAVAILTA